jgi:hypothetical protein
MKDERLEKVNKQFRQLVSDLRDLQSTSAEVEHRGVAIAITHVETAELWFKTSIVEASQS